MQRHKIENMMQQDPSPIEFPVGPYRHCAILTDSFLPYPSTGDMKQKMEQFINSR